MFVVLGILFFVAWLATYFFRMNVPIVVSYILIGLAVLSIVVHFVLRSRRSSPGGQ